MRSVSDRIPKTFESLKSLRPGAFFLPLVLLLFVLFKSGYLHLPFYWDEAWSYANAIFDMHDHGITLLPGSENVELTRGHPLFFYFLSAWWMRFFGTGPVAAHMLPLLLSCLLILVLFLFCRNHFNRITAMVTVSFFVLQSVFLAQSALLLPEVLIALLVMTSVLAYFGGYRGLYIFSASLLVLTKETGLVVVAVFLLDAWVIRRFFFPQQNHLSASSFFPPKDRSSHRRLKTSWYLLFPVAVFILYIMLQKIRYGWFFYPEHVNMIDLSWSGMLNNSKAFVTGLFLRNGRVLFLLLSVAGYAVLRVRKCLSDRERHFLLFSALLVIAYGAFSVINFFTQRYLLALLSVYLAAGSMLLTSFLSQRRIFFGAAVTGLLVFFAWQTWYVSWNESDVSLGYKDTVLLHRDVVRYAGEQGWQDKLVYSAFLMQYNMSQPRLGYLAEGQEPFFDVKNIPGLPYELYIFCSNEQDSMRERLASDSNFILLKRFERTKAWVEIYVPIKQLDTP